MSQLPMIALLSCFCGNGFRTLESGHARILTGWTVVFFRGHCVLGLRSSTKAVA